MSALPSENYVENCANENRLCSVLSNVEIRVISASFVFNLAAKITGKDCFVFSQLSFTSDARPNLLPPGRRLFESQLS